MMSHCQARDSNASVSAKNIARFDRVRYIMRYVRNVQGKTRLHEANEIPLFVSST